MLRIVLAPAESIIEEDVVALEFPTVRISRALPAPGIARIPISSAEWASPSFDPWVFDDALARAAEEDPFALHLVAGAGEDLTPLTLRVLSRAQWAIGRRNRASWGARFDPLLERYRLLHDPSKPLSRADLEHGLDTWQWVLRLRPAASHALQAAALFHDVARAASEADARVEHLATDPDAWRRAHAEASARLARPLLADVVDDPIALERACEWIASHGEPPASSEAATLADADALSYLQKGHALACLHYDERFAERKLGEALSRLSPDGLARLPIVGHVSARSRSPGGLPGPLPLPEPQLPRAPIES